MEFQSGAVSPVGSIEKGWNLIKNDYWTFFLMTLVATIIIIIAAVILGAINNLVVLAVSAALGAGTSGSSDAVKMSTSIFPQLLSMFISLFTNILVGALSGVMFVGIYSALARKASTGAADFGDLFSGFQKFVPCLIVAAVVALVQFLLSVVMLVIGMAVGVSTVGLGGLIGANGKPNPSLLGGLVIVVLLFGLVYLVINIIISALTTFAYPLIANRNLSGGEALGLSVRSGLANIGGLILLIILIFLMSMGGALLCLVGIFFVAPIIVASIFAAYQSVFGAAQSPYIQTPPPPPTFGNQPGY